MAPFLEPGAEMAALGLRNRRSQAQSDYTSLSRVCLLSEQLTLLLLLGHLRATCAPLPGPSAAQAQGWQAGARKRLTPEPPQASLGILYRMTVCVTWRQARAAEPERRGVLRQVVLRNLTVYCHNYCNTL